jgi:hypothetical protein
VQYQHYDMLLILDSDAIMYDFSRDISTLLPNNRMMVAHKVRANDTDSTWNINIGVTLWNLRHSAALAVCKAWKKCCIERILYHSTLRDSDQTPLQALLRNVPEKQRKKMIVATAKELGYRHGQLVRHFIRPDSENWTDYSITMDYRIAGIQNTIREICRRSFTASNHPDVCEGQIPH